MSAQIRTSVCMMTSLEFHRETAVARPVQHYGMDGTTVPRHPWWHRHPALQAYSDQLTGTCKRSQLSMEVWLSVWCTISTLVCVFLKRLEPGQLKTDWVDSLSGLIVHFWWDGISLHNIHHQTAGATQKYTTVKIKDTEALWTQACGIRGPCI